MEANCKMFLTLLRQNDLKPPLDRPGWVGSRIRVCQDLETFTGKESGEWDHTIERVRLRIESTEESLRTVDLFSMRAYLETSRLQFRNREAYRPNVEPAKSFEQKAEREARRIRKGNRVSGDRQSFDGWELAYRLIRRRVLNISDEWGRTGKNIATTINGRAIL